MALTEKALSLPGGMEHWHVLFQGGTNFIFAQDYDRAEELFDIGVERWPDNESFRIMRATCYFFQGRLDESLEEVEHVQHWRRWRAFVPRLRARVFAQRGETAKAEAELQTLLDHPEYSNQKLCVAYTLAGLGRYDEAIDWFEKSADVHDSHIAAILNYPSVPQELRDHPRFQAFLRRIGMADIR